MLQDETSRFLAAWMHVRQVVQAANFNRFQRAGLSATQFMALNVIPEEGLTLTELARKLNLSPASLKITVDSLAERGLVLRRKSAQDARKVDILSTKQGVRLRNASSEDFHRSMASIFAAMKPTERRGLLRGLERLVELSALHMDQENDPAASNLRAGGAPPAGRSVRRSPRQ